MSFGNVKWVWKNGEIIPWENASVHVSSHGLHYGSGVFEGIRSYKTENGAAVFRLREHLERFFESAATYGFKIPYTLDELSEATGELIRKNDLKDCYIRPICYLGSGSLGLHPGKCPVEVSILAWPWATYLGAEGLERGIRVTVSPWRKFHSSMMPTTAKACGQYLNSILAVKDAFLRGFDEALLLDMHGKLSEGSGENIFVVKSNKILTNQSKDSILMGITRDTVLAIASELKIETEIKPIELYELLDADEVFLTGTAAEVTPVREVDGQMIGNGTRGKITERVQSAFFEITTGQNERFRKWSHNVY